MTAKKKRTPTISIIILAGGLSSRMGRDKSRIRIGRRTMLGHIRQIATQLDLPIRVVRRDAIPRSGPIGGIYTALTRARADAILFLACDMPFVTTAFLNQMLRTFRSNVAQVSKPADLSPLGSGERDCGSKATARPAGPSEGERASQSPISKSAHRGNFRARKLFRGQAGFETRDTADLEVCATIKFPSPPAIFASHKNLFGLPCLISRDSLPLIQTQIANQQLSLQSLARVLKAKPLVPSRHPAHQLQNLNTPADLASALHKTTVPQG